MLQLVTPLALQANGTKSIWTYVWFLTTRWPLEGWIMPSVVAPYFNAQQINVFFVCVKSCKLLCQFTLMRNLSWYPWHYCCFTRGVFGWITKFYLKWYVPFAQLLFSVFFTAVKRQSKMSPLQWGLLFKVYMVD